MEKASYERNIKWYKYYIVFSGALFIWPIEVLFLKNRGFSFTNIMVIESVISIVQLILEIPSGILGDKIGCKKTVLLGLIFQISAYIILLFNVSLLGAYVYSILLACGYAFVSGADTALLYESHKILNKEADYGKTIRSAGSIKMFVLAFVTLISGALYKINLNIPYILSIVFLFISFVFILAFKEIKINNENIFSSNTSYLKETLCLAKKTFLHNKNIQWIILIALLFTFLFTDINYFMQAYMGSLNIRITYYGVIFFICNIISAIALKYSGKIETKLGENTRIIMSIFITFIFIFAAYVNNIWGLFVLCFTRVVVATISPILNVRINRNIPSKSRASLLSVYYAILSIFVAIFDPIMGKLLDTYGINKVYYIIGIIGIVLSGLLLYEKRNKKSQST